MLSLDDLQSKVDNLLVLIVLCFLVFVFVFLFFSTSPVSVIYLLHCSPHTVSLVMDYNVNIDISSITKLFIGYGIPCNPVQ